MEWSNKVRGWEGGRTESVGVEKGGGETTERDH